MEQAAGPNFEPRENPKRPHRLIVKAPRPLFCLQPKTQTPNPKTAPPTRRRSLHFRAIPGYFGLFHLPQFAATRVQVASGLRHFLPSLKDLTDALHPHRDAHDAHPLLTPFSKNLPTYPGYSRLIRLTCGPRGPAPSPPFVPSQETERFRHETSLFRVLRLSRWATPVSGFLSCIPCVSWFLLRLRLLLFRRISLHIPAILGYSRLNPAGPRICKESPT